MKKILLSAFIIIAFSGYVLRQKLHLFGDEDTVTLPLNATNTAAMSGTNDSVAATNTDTTGGSTPPTNTSTVTNSASANTSKINANTTITNRATNTNTAAKGQYRNGSYTGSVADAFYGNVQVKAVISGGKLADVQFLQYPNDRGHSIEINQYATPLLKQEAITAQNANVDLVSGATATSEAFIQSLTNALSQAAV